MPVSAKKLSQEPFDAVANDGVPDSRAHRDAQSAFFPIVCLADDDKMGGVNLASPLGQAQEFGSFSKTGLFGKPRPAPRQLSTCFYVRARFGGTTTVNLFLPFALRRLRTFLPPGVAIRARKPCVRLRFMLLG